MVEPRNNKDLYGEVLQLKVDMAHVNTLVDRLDIAIEKLTELSTNISQLLAVQGSRLEYQQKFLEDLAEINDRRHQEFDRKLQEKLKELDQDIGNVKNKFNDKLSQIERWIWLVSGGAVVVAFIITKIFPSIKFF